MKRKCNFIDRTGEHHLNNEGYWMTIIEYVSNRECTIQFDEGCTIYKLQYNSIIKGNVKNPYHPSVFGIGYLGEGRHLSKKDKKIAKSYNTWSSMLERGYDTSFNKKNPSYVNCLVNEEWHNFQNFGDWFEQNWKPYMDRSWELDKDILIKNNKIYSPETCCFVPKEINNLFIKNNVRRGECPIGVHRVNNVYIVTCKTNAPSSYGGTYSTPEDAFQAYKIIKEIYIKETADKWRGQITEPCYEAMYNYKVEVID